jgi:hypothetical protein
LQPLAARADWTCYAVEVDGAGGVRFIDAWGNISAGIS